MIEEFQELMNAVQDYRQHKADKGRMLNVNMVTCGPASSGHGERGASAGCR